VYIIQETTEIEKFGGQSADGNSQSLPTGSEKSNGGEPEIGPG
jgi:hypothetical protein